VNRDLARRATAEAIGTAILLAAVVGSGVMGERLAGGNIAIALFANSIATGAALLAAILTFSTISGAHLNPVVTLTEAYWFTASTSFANPAVTLARSASNTFAGIRPSDAPGVYCGATFGSYALFRWLIPKSSNNPVA
jgi:glycerol uptake facilitator-like aquaporin